MNFQITVLGSNSAVPAFGRHPSAQVVEVANKPYLIDCGEGTQMQMNDLGIKKSRVDQIFITHLHGDHIFGLFGLLNSYRLLGREKKLSIFSPTGLEDTIMPILGKSSIPFSYELEFNVIEKPGLIFKDDNVNVRAFELDHSLETYGFLFRENTVSRKIKEGVVEKYNIPFEKIEGLRAGEDLTQADGTIVPNAELTEIGRTPRSFAYASDTRYSEKIIPEVTGVDLLYHESSFLKEDSEKAFERGHSTAEQAAEIARKAAVGALLLGHFSAKHGDLLPFEEEAKAIFPNTLLAKEGDVIQLEV